MNPPPEPALAADKKPFDWRAFCVWPFAVLFLYILSFGPMMRFAQKDLIPPAFNPLWRLYTPMFWTYWNTPLQKPLGIYLHLWDPEDFDKRGLAKL